MAMRTTGLSTKGPTRVEGGALLGAQRQQQPQERHEPQRAEVQAEGAQRDQQRLRRRSQERGQVAGKGARADRHAERVLQDQVARHNPASQHICEQSHKVTHLQNGTAQFFSQIKAVHSNLAMLAVWYSYQALHSVGCSL